MFSILSLAFFASSTLATILPVLRQNPCRAVVRGACLTQIAFPCLNSPAQLNGSSIDLGPQFQWPVRIANVSGNSPSGFYDYSWDCNGQSTPCGHGVSVCQCFAGSTTTCFEAGGDPKSALWFADNFGAPSTLSISYPSTYLRMSTVTLSIGSFASFAASTPCESPTENYNFVATIVCKSGMFRQC